MGLLPGPTERLIALELSATHFSFGCKSWACAARARRVLTAEKGRVKPGRCVSGRGFFSVAILPFMLEGPLWSSGMSTPLGNHTNAKAIMRRIIQLLCG